MFVRMKGLCIVAGIAMLGGCTSGEGDAARLPDSAALEAPAEPAPAVLPVQAESVSTTRAEPSRSTTTPPARPSTTPRARPATTQPGRNAAPVLRQPPPPRDTRPSIPYPPDTL